MRFGICILPQLPWREQADLWRRAEAFGFDHAWTYDHLTWDPLADEAWGATWPTLVAAATVTTRIELGPWVASPNFRHPVPFAKDVQGLDDVSGGRALVAVGAGTPRRDGRVLGSGAAGGRDLSAGERAGRLEEFVHLLRLLTTDRETTFEGRFYEALEARSYLPGTDPLGPGGRRPPLLVAANGPRLMRLAAQAGDGWVTLGPGPSDDVESWWDGVRAMVERFDELAPEGRRRLLNLDSAPTFSLASLGAFEDAVGRAAALGFTDVVSHWPRPAGLYAGDERVLEQVAEALPRLG
ncbi:LLM class flavin-dependent oxidoreductase [Spongisporangium articulatum]|uniref:LLM class flavin-dependent oxidoreductase n=1 Tax=Spongisporangium articulatum TaxID=3362603 RepID=A0ABW8AJ31_9ACTN